MNRHFFTVAFGAGALAVVWVGAGFVGTNLLALLMTAIIAVVYALGALELRQFRQATATLTTALGAIPQHLASLGDWLESLHPSLQNPVRLRVEGERTALPGPVLTPYLVGLLVMLGMLGTFLGMVVTLNGAVFALEGTTDLHAIRAALAAPIKGLGLAFGTSVAGVAASAMLGLMSALCRRERLQAAQLLDTKIASSLRDFSLTHQRQETFKALQLQSRAMPEVADKLQAMMTQMERMSQQLSERLLGNQENFHQDVKGVYTELARAVDQSLKDSLTQSAQAAGASIKPVVEAAMSEIANDARLMHQRVVDTAQRQLDGLSAQINATALATAESFAQRSEALLATVGTAYESLQSGQAARARQQQEAWTHALESLSASLNREWQQTGAQTRAEQQQLCAALTKTAQDITAQAQASATTTLGEITRLMTCSEELLRSRIASEADWIKQHGERMDQLSGLLSNELGALRDQEAQRGDAAVARLAALQEALINQVTTQLTALGAGLEGPITRLVHTASEAPRAAAEVIGQLRQELSSSVARDNELLEERSRIMATLNSLLAAINHASVEQRAVIDALVASSAQTLNQAGQQFATQLDTETAKLADIGAHVTGSAVEVASLSETLSFAVNSFSEANAKLIASLQRIEAAMDKSLARSDDQLAYYVAQAREIIDLSVMSQKDIVGELRQLPGKPLTIAEEVS